MVTGNRAPRAYNSRRGAVEDGGARTGRLIVRDADKDNLTYSLVNKPRVGEVTLNDDGTYQFDPGNDFQDLGVGEFRDVTFTYEVNDGRGGKDQATVTIRVKGANDAPEALGGTRFNAAEDNGPVHGELRAKDIDGDKLTFALVKGPRQGKLTINPDGQYSYDPGNDFQDLGVGETREISFVYDVFDRRGGTDQAEVKITVHGANDAPVALGGTRFNAAEDNGPVFGDLRTKDIDGDKLTFALVKGPREGSVTIDPEGHYTFDPGNDFQDLNQGESRTVSFVYDVFDGHGGTDQAEVTITVHGANEPKPRYSAQSKASDVLNLNQAMASFSARSSALDESIGLSRHISDEAGLFAAA